MEGWYSFSVAPGFRGHISFRISLMQKSSVPVMATSFGLKLVIVYQIIPPKQGLRPNDNHWTRDKLANYQIIPPKQGLFRIENSKLSDWVTEESCGIYDSSELIHICIVTDEDLIDIISTFEPEIEITPI